MRQITPIHILLSFLTATNLLIYIFRDQFQFMPYATKSGLYSTCGQECMNTWQTFRDDYPATELDEAKHLTDSVIGDEQSTSKKVLAIGRFIYQRFYKQAGTPPSALNEASPMEQYKMLSASDSLQLWCGNYASMFSWFCWSQGIITRNVEIMRPGDRHVLNECYLGETGQWVMSDITHHLFLMRDSTGNFLNIEDFREGLRNKTPMVSYSDQDTSLSIANVDTGATAIRKYYKPTYPLFYYHRLNNSKVYSPSMKIKRYLLPVSWFDILDDEPHSNAFFYIKEVFLFLWVITLFVFLVTRTKFRI
ncbi:MAG: hypothetical protein ACJ75F_08805 [Flavisolibacter sp.]